MDVLGCLRIRVRRGINLAVRDTISSDPYVTVTCGSQKVKTKVVKGNCNPRWNQDLTICIKNVETPILLSVYDKDTFTGDDSMGKAKIDIKPLVECIKMGLESLPDGTKVDRVQPSKENDLADESPIVWNKGKMTQDMLLRLKNVECGEVEIQIEWIELPGNIVGLSKPSDTHHFCYLPGSLLALPSSRKKKKNPNRPKVPAKLNKIRPVVKDVLEPVKLHKLRPVVKDVLIPLRRFKKGLTNVKKCQIEDANKAPNTTTEEEEKA